MLHFFRENGPGKELCFCVEVSRQIEPQRQALLATFFQELPNQLIQRWSFLSENLATVGPRLAFATAYSSNAVAVLNACGFPEVTRVEVLRREQISDGQQVPNFDRMTEMLYSELPKTFVSDAIPEPVRIIPVLAGGVDELRRINKELGLSWDDGDVVYFYHLIKDFLRRDPTDVECFGLGIAAADHTRHRTWNAKLVIDGEVRPHTLFDLAKAPYLALGGESNCVIAFHDNASAIRGYRVGLMVRKNPTGSSFYLVVQEDVDLTLTVETHNHPSQFGPWDGAGTGIGGDLRDSLAPGIGGSHNHAIAGYFTGNLWIPGFVQPWERLTRHITSNAFATPLQIALKAPAGCHDYGNKYGVPVTNGCRYTVEMDLPVGDATEHYSYVKPIMLAGMAGQMRHSHIVKKKRKPGQLLVRIGGPAYRIGLGGGPASSMMAGTNAAGLDFDSVQRANAQMGQLTWRVIEASVEMGEQNPISFIHDQGAGGIFNVFSELCEVTGGKIEIRKVTIGDVTMSVVAITCSEFQESYGVLVEPENWGVFQELCAREGCPCELLGELTDDMHFVVYDEKDGTKPVDLPLDEVLSGLPQKTIEDVSPPKIGKLPQLPAGLTVREALERVLRLPAVASKEDLTRRVDRSVGGRVMRQQGCGPLHLPVSDMAVTAVSFLDNVGEATALGVQPLKTMLDATAGTRLAGAEAITNIVWAGINQFSDVSFSVNWMWPAKLKLPGEIAKLERAAVAGKDFLIALGIKEDGGKDSGAMATKVADEVIKSPETVVFTAYAPVPDVTRTITPDLKLAGGSCLLLMRLNTKGKNRLGGSALFQCYGQIGDVSPDVDDPLLFKRSIEAVTEMIRKGLLLSGHDCSDGGLIVALLEMCFPSNIGMEVSIDGVGLALDCLFAEEPQLVMECRAHDLPAIREIAGKHQVEIEEIGQTTYSLAQEARIRVSCSDREVLNESVHDLRVIWQEFAYQMERLAINPVCADAEREANMSLDDMVAPRLNLSFVPKVTQALDMVRPGNKKPVVAVIREEGSNGDRELVAAFRSVGFSVMDVIMSDLLTGKIADLKGFRGVAFPGGFSYSDVFGAGVAWAKKIQLHPHLREIFSDFYERRDTFSFGPCNGCQLMARLGWVPFGPELGSEKQPLFVRNISRAFESRPVVVEIRESPAIMLRGMAGCRLPVWVAHGEGRLWFPDEELAGTVRRMDLAPLCYVHPNGSVTERYPFNPNGSPNGWAGLCDKTGRHLAIMPHPERMWQMRQWPWVPCQWWNFEPSPWLRIFQNAYDWCCGK